MLDDPIITRGLLLREDLIASQHTLGAYLLTTTDLDTDALRNTLSSLEFLRVVYR